ncbi:MAG: antibiotic biosynthesis monooxygenase [Oscillospiraceae bacterium]
MVVVMFEVELNDGCKEEYYSLSKNLQSALSKQKGFLGGTTYICEGNPNREMSINYWENEASVVEWRNFMGHRICQKEGRDGLFKSYKITVSREIRTYTNKMRSKAPIDSNIFFSKE